MSFNSAYWTVPELCVWIVTRRIDDLNRLAPRVRRSLTFCDLVHKGAYAARDIVLEAGQQDRIKITCAGEPDRYRSNPDRRTLSPEFWKTAELEDASHWTADGAKWCVARQVGRPNGKDFTDLLVSSAAAKELWTLEEEQAISPSAPIDEPIEGDSTPRPKGERDPRLPEKMAQWYAGNTPDGLHETWAEVARRYAGATGTRLPSEDSVKRMRALLRERKKAQG